MRISNFVKNICIPTSHICDYKVGYLYLPVDSFQYRFGISLFINPLSQNVGIRTCSLNSKLINIIKICRKWH